MIGSIVCEHRLAHDLADLGAVPPLGHGQHRLAHPDEAVLVGPEVEVDQLRDGGPGDEPAVDQPALEEGPAERGDGGPVDDRLVEIEECRLHTFNGTGDSTSNLSHRDEWRIGARTLCVLNWGCEGGTPVAIRLRFVGRLGTVLVRGPARR